METKFTIENDLLVDSLKAISEYRENGGKYDLVIIGGVATQLYASYSRYPEFLRATHDIDLNTNTRIKGKVDFRENIGNPIASHLTDYNPEVTTRGFYSVKLTDEENTSYLIHMVQYGKQFFETKRHGLERQVSNANMIRYPKFTPQNNLDFKIKIVRLEDIIAGKEKRIQHLKERGLNTYEEETNLLEERDWVKLGEIELSSRLKHVNIERNNLLAYMDGGRPKNKKELNRYNMEKDIFDICLLSRLFTEGKLNFDESYYEEALGLPS